ncbi:hypothetical protein CIB84_015710 [Bambusicola thoracicus]|uniref:Uncharacterized protein n=1 Tax=Bambusicola thoracicus TaxID=9083 RepID=A0A2P4S8X5_BAMTH|nr:hypothetical protein CIB84_015710 [Bambusicola thoracicus]
MPGKHNTIHIHPPFDLTSRKPNPIIHPRTYPNISLLSMRSWHRPSHTSSLYTNTWL